MTSSDIVVVVGFAVGGQSGVIGERFESDSNLEHYHLERGCIVQLVLLAVSLQPD